MYFLVSNLQKTSSNQESCNFDLIQTTFWPIETCTDIKKKLCLNQNLAITQLVLMGVAYTYTIQQYTSYFVCIL